MRSTRSRVCGQTVCGFRCGEHDTEKGDIDDHEGEIVARLDADFALAPTVEPDFVRLER